MKDDEAGGGDDFVDVLEKAVEEKVVPGWDLADLMREADAEESIEDPAQFVVVMFHFRSGDGCSGGGISQEGFEVAVVYFSKYNIAGFVASLLCFLGERCFGEGDKVGGAHAEGACKAKYGIQFDGGLVPFEFGDDCDRDAGEGGEFCEGEGVALPETAEDGKVEFRSHGETEGEGGRLADGGADPPRGCLSGLATEPAREIALIGNADGGTDGGDLDAFGKQFLRVGETFLSAELAECEACFLFDETVEVVLLITASANDIFEGGVEADVLNQA